MEPASDQAPVEAPRARRLGWAAFPLGLFALTRAALLTFSYVSLRLDPRLEYPGGDRAYLIHYPALDGLCRWDCGWFAQLAQLGYQSPTDTNFFPLMPLLARGLHALTGAEVHLAVVLIANLASLASYLVLYRLFARLDGERAARWSLALFAAYPFAFFQAAGYPESMLVLFTSLALLLAIQGEHLAGGTALGFGVLARHLSMLAGGGLLVAQLRQRGLHPKRFLGSPDVLGLLVPWLFLGGYCAFQAKAFRDPLAFWHARDQWGGDAYLSVLRFARALAQNPRAFELITPQVPYALFLTAGMVALLFRRRWWDLAGFALPMHLMLWGIGMAGIGRYTASCWPTVLPLGLWLSRRHWAIRIAFLAALLAGQGYFFFLFSHQYHVL